MTLVDTISRRSARGRKIQDEHSWLELTWGGILFVTLLPFVSFGFLVKVLVLLVVEFLFVLIRNIPISLLSAALFVTRRAGLPVEQTYHDAQH